MDRSALAQSRLGTLDLWLLDQNPLLTPPLANLLLQQLRLASGLANDAVVASTGDYDGDGSVDVLWRYDDGRLAVTYLVGGRRCVMRRFRS
jgi:hypothetical protein